MNANPKACGTRIVVSAIKERDWEIVRDSVGKIAVVRSCDHWCLIGVIEWWSL